MTTGQAGFVDEVFGFTGRYFDAATGLQNNLHRWYDPRIGRWLSEDPIGFAAGDANLYRYVNNEPTTLRDPNGLLPAYGWGVLQGQIVDDHSGMAPAPGSAPRPLFRLPPTDEPMDMPPNFLPPPGPGLQNAPDPWDKAWRARPPGPDWKYDWPKPQNFLDELADEIKQLEKLDDMNNTRDALEEHNRHRGNPWRDRIRIIDRTPALR